VIAKAVSIHAPPVQFICCIAAACQLLASIAKHVANAVTRCFGPVSRPEAAREFLKNAMVESTAEQVLENDANRMYCPVSIVHDASTTQLTTPNGDGIAYQLNLKKLNEIRQELKTQGMEKLEALLPRLLSQNGIGAQEHACRLVAENTQEPGYINLVKYVPIESRFVIDAAAKTIQHTLSWKQIKERVDIHNGKHETSTLKTFQTKAVYQEDATDPLGWRVVSAFSMSAAHS
jgi:hypothetical protein